MGSSVNNDNGIVHNVLHKTAFKFVLAYPLPVNIVRNLKKETNDDHYEIKHL
jgi:hypothetical protein